MGYFQQIYGVVTTITGPGVTNVATPVASAYSDSIPLLVISSSLPRSATRHPKGLLHEIKNQAGVMEALAGWTRVVEHVEELPYALNDAFRALRQGRPRGAYLQVPLDLLQAEADVEIPEPAEIVLPQPEKESLDAAARLLREARRPLIIAGAGVTAAAANTHLARLAELLGAPVILGNKSHDVLPSEHPLVISVNNSAPAEVYALIEKADVALIVGSKLGLHRTGEHGYPLPQALIQVDIDPAEIGRHYPVRIGLAADARLTLEALLERLHDQPFSRDQAALLAELERIRKALRERCHKSYGEMVHLLDGVREGLPNNGIVVADMTMLGYASAQYLPTYEPRTYIHPNELCTIGCGLPLALGAKVGAPERQVITLCGDGGFLLNTGELAAAVQEKIPVVIIIFNDSTFTAVKRAQHYDYAKHYIATDLVAPDYVALAHAFHAEGMRAENPEALRDAIRKASSLNKPTIIEVPLPAREW
ncbi:thiamine pyrophosphate-binding protein [Ktedonosporobacter rubrisoli]|uniref:Thiamine pyrophosphate-binding protein n=1 Tax=Ktedonosporobacter rubrisoli TaxID=2509675 RepID=A0A4P6JR69_KTERU|nr:thiamine pyrophosphate-binding protein [Ktedonosporobacter rubrisoli]QBD77824.1 thiamine pyrophosphate-binding protein [Ktedonosporobacter rubrisoli]